MANRKWISRKDEAAPVAVESKDGVQEESFERDAGHRRKENIRNEAEHIKTKKGAEGLKKAFYGHKTKGAK